MNDTMIVVLLRALFGGLDFTTRLWFLDRFQRVAAEHGLDWEAVLATLKGEPPSPRLSLREAAIADAHRAADRACGRDWLCACGVCRRARSG